MAAIDKTYIDGKDYEQYREWWIEHYDKMIKEMGDAIWLYPFSYYNQYTVDPELLRSHTDDIEYYKNCYDFPIWSTSEATDKWLVKNCNIPSFRESIVDKYPYNWSGFKKQKWVRRPDKKLKYRR